MASKLKIVVNYPCNVYCDYELQGKAESNKILSIELRKGTYLLEFKIGDEIIDSLDYTIESNDEDCLLRRDVMQSTQFQLLERIKNKKILDTRQYDLNDGDSVSRVLITFNSYSNTYKELTHKGYTHFYSKNKTEFDEHNNGFYFVLETSDRYDENKNILTIPVLFDVPTSLVNVNVDATLVRNNNGMFIVYLDDKVRVYEINEAKISRRFDLDINFGYIYSIDYPCILTLKNDKFGIYNIEEGRTICQNKYDRIYIEDLEYHGDIIKAFKNTDKYIVENDGKCGIIDRNGNILIPCKYDAAYINNFGYVVCENKKWGITYNGETPKEWYEDIFHPIQTGYGLSSLHYINEKIECNSFPVFYLLFYKKNGKIGYWTFDGDKNINLYDSIDCDYAIGCGLDRLFRVHNCGYIGYLDIYGQEIIPCIYDEIIQFPYNESLTLYCDYILYKNKNIKSAYLRELENIIDNDEFIDKSWSLETKLAKHIGYEITEFIAKKNGKWGVGSIDGMERLPYLYDSIEKEYDKTYIVEKNGLYGVLCTGTNDNVIVPISCGDKESVKKKMIYTMGLI